MDEIISKSEKKRQAEALKKLGLSFISLPLNKLAKLPLDDNLRSAVMQAKSLKSHGAIRRQAQLIGKLMRCADGEAIQAAYDEIIADDNTQTAEFHQLEIWRERLVNEGNEALTEFVNVYPAVDVQQLRLLVKKAREEQTQERSFGASKSLFRFLRACL